MEHQEFVQKYKSGAIAVSVDRNKAGFMYQSPSLLPDRLRTQQALARTVAFGGVLGGIVAFFFAPWWLALGIIMIGFCGFPTAQRLAAAGVLEAAIENPLVYDLATERGVLFVRERT